MPSTINGIGTHYYGASNVQSRPGLCEFCHQPVELRSYDTRLWFVILFIPIIPLGRKRILDYCPQCTRHRMMALREWDKLKAERLREATELMKRQPDNAEAARKLHGGLIAFGQMAEADKLVAVMRQRFAGDAGTQAYLGSAMQYLGRGAEAVPYYQRALELNPELPEARVAVGLHLVQQDKPAEAHKLLQFLEAPEAEPHPGALFALAEAYQRTSQHPEALKLFRLLSGRFPELAQDKGFRKAVQVSERAVGAGASQLPSRKFNFKPLRNWAIAAVVVLALLFGSNFYIAQHRTLYVVSGLNQRVDVEIQGAGSLSLNKPGMWMMTVPEGRHQATLRGGLTQTAEFTIKSDFFGRWFDKPAFILNAGGTAVLMVSHTVYSATPDPNAEMPFELYFGEPFLSLNNVDYHFVEFPDSLRLDRRAGEVSKSRVDLFRHSVEDLFFSLVRDGKLDRALPLAEWHLRLHPEATAILPAYVALAKAGQRDRQADALLAEAVKRRPIEIPWHRAYQERHMSAREMPALIREYEALLAAEPANSALLYLRGRLCSKTRDCMALFERAIAADPKNAHAHFALAYDQSSAGNWAAARAHLAAAVELRPEEQQFQEAWYEARLALQEGPALEAELRKQLEKKPLNIDLNFKLCEVLLSQGRGEAARKLDGDYEREALRRFPREGASYTRAFRQELLYALGDFAGLEKLLAGEKGEESQFDKFKALLEGGKLPAAEALYPLNSEDMKDPFHFLAFSIAWNQAGDLVKGVLCRDKCVRLLRQATLREQALARLLERARPVTLADVSEITLDAAHKAIVLTALGQRFPEQRADMFAAARRLNVRRVYPYHLLNRVTGSSDTPLQLLSK